ncbi:fidgetin isoform X2 [Hyalella azteca]|uniref:Fidgetin isoform X2 n=1 Tax=Hyalella azteca TaxID=294128 RepID=A0A979FSM8_HYAAZ|nr:fidgetin isoform X2 [Hyalella azteca]
MINAMIQPATSEMPSGADLDMIEALLAHMQQQNPGSAAAAGHMYEDLHDDDDDEDYDDDEEDDDEEDYYTGDQHNINMFQNPYNGGGEGGGSGGGEVDAGAVSLLQGLLGMSGAGGMGEMGLAGMGASIMGAPMDAGGAGFDMNSFLPNMSANVGAALAGAFGAAAGGLMDGLGSPGNGGGATIHEYDEDDDEDITEGSGASEDEDDEEDSEEDDEGHIGGGGAHMAAMAAMGGMAAGGGIAAMAAMMSQPKQQQHQMYASQPGPVLPHSSPYVSLGSVNQPMYSPSMTGPPSSSHATTMSSLAAAAVASAAAAMSLPGPSNSHSMPLSCPPTVLAPPMSISSGLGGGTMSRVDPLAALAMGGAAVVGGAVLGKVVSTVSNNTGGGTALVQSNHLSSIPSTGPAMHKSLDELNKLSDSMANVRISQKPMSPHNPAMQAAYSHQHLAQMHNAGPQQMAYGHQFMLPGMIRPPMSTGMHVMPPHCVAMASPNSTNPGKNNDGDKTSLDRESVPCSETSGGGKSDTESTTKKTPSPTLVGPGRVSPDSSSGSSSSGSDRGHVKNATSFASLSDLPSATESMRDSDTDHMEQQRHQLQRRLHEMEHEPMNRPNGGVLMPNAVPMLIETPGYGWSSLVGHENAKDALKNLFQGSKFPEVFDSQGSCRGVLLFGPSGAGKTSLARSLAYEAGGARLIACTPSFIMSRSMHPQTAAGLIRNMFDHARVHKPCVMLMDEIEMLALPELTEAGKWAKAELMAQVRGETTLKPSYPTNSINEQVMLVATTCSPWVLPDELRRLFAYNIHIKLPAEKQREELFRMFLNNYANNVTSDQYKCLLSKSEGYSAADIHTVVRQASYNPPTQQSINGNNQHHQNHPRVVTFDDLASVMTNYRCLYKAEHMSYYKKYIQEATHRTEDIRDDDDKKGKPKGVKKLGRFAKSLAAAVISVID